MLKTPTQAIIEIIENIRNRLTEETDIVWTRYNSVLEIQIEIESVLQALQDGDVTVLDDFRMHFGPTSTFQEISISNGWGEEFLHLANDFESLHDHIKAMQKFRHR
jgi:hypothetical protein